MLKLTLLFLEIITGLYLLTGFIIYGFALGEQKYLDSKHKKYLGLSVDGMKFKATSNNPKIKLFGFILCLVFIPGSIFYNIIKNKTADFPTLDHFSIW